MIYAYVRVSTYYQLKGNSIDNQKEQVLERYPDAQIYVESESGKRMDRPVFQSVLRKLNKGDIFVVTKLDRFCRSTQEGLKYIEKIQKMGCSIHILNQGLIEYTAVGKLIVTNMLAFAEFERTIILERTLAGKEIARRRADFREGRPKKYTKKQLDHAMELLKNHTYKEVSDLTGISKSTLKRYKREHNID